MIIPKLILGLLGPFIRMIRIFTLPLKLIKSHMNLYQFKRAFLEEFLNIKNSVISQWVLKTTNSKVILLQWIFELIPEIFQIKILNFLVGKSSQILDNLKGKIYQQSIIGS